MVSIVDLLFQRTLALSVSSFGLLLTLIFLEIIVASSLVFVCESALEDTLFDSIPSTSWWAFVTVCYSMTKLSFFKMLNLKHFPKLSKIEHFHHDEAAVFKVKNML